MAYTALYRELRPKKFSDVTGQKHIVRTLKNQLAYSRLSHAYLFCGTRGTGKTSTAKIFAKAVNCTQLQDGEPCDQCESCITIASGRTLNIIEIDAASNNGVENIREINDEVKYTPTDIAYKVYIVDEVHMLSISAFNALLKTLEEPPSHVIFILATTDPQKIPVTIHSRCQRFDFKRISSQDMIQAMQQYLSSENICVTEDALAYISEISDGAMRDALSTLDQCIAFYFNEEITLEKVQDTLGAVSRDVLFDFAKSLNSHNTERVMMLIGDITLQGRDLSQFINELIHHFRNLLVIKKSGSNTLDLSAQYLDKLKAQSEKMDFDTLICFINAFSDLQAQLKYSSNPRILLEVTCIKVCNPLSEPTNADTIFSRLNKLENLLYNNKSNNVELVQKSEPIQTKPKSVPSDIKNVCSKWSSFISSFNSKDEIIIKNWLQTSTARYLEGDLLAIVFESLPVCKSIQKKEEESSIIKNRLAKMFDKEFSIIFFTQKEYDDKHTVIYGETDSYMYEEEFAKNNIPVEIED